MHRVLMALAVFVSCVLPGAAASKPNIIFLLSDDLSWGDLGCYGQTQILTPNIDRLAAEGMRFTNAYAGNSVCAPSRSCLMQGLHPGHARVRGNSFSGYRHSLQPEDITVAQLLQQSGYTTGLFGKWGLALYDQPGIPNNRGFDEFFGYLNQRHAHSYYPPYLYHNQTRVPYPQHAGHDHHAQSTYDPVWGVQPAGVKKPAATKYSFGEIHSRSLDFIRRHHKQPFFVYLAHTIPHGPVIAPDLAPYTNKDWAIGHKEWAAMVSRLDTAVGEILALLADLKIDNNTLIIFASDNGHSAHGYNRDKSVVSIGDHFQSYGPTRGRKGDSYDGAFRVPAIARWPGKIAANQVNNHIWAFWDFLPTAAEIAGAEIEFHTDGVSFLPTLLGTPDKQKPQQYLYWEYNKNQAIRSDNWFAHRANGGDVELYDLAKDPQQQNNLAARHPDLAAQILRWMNESHTPSEVWPSPGETKQSHQARLKQIGALKRPRNIDR